MTDNVTLSLTVKQHERLRHHLFPEDGSEAVAIALCGRRAGHLRHRLLVQEIHEIPHDSCSERTPDRVSWSTDILVPLLEKAESHRLSVVKIHSHRSDFREFSHLDDVSDNELLPAIRGWVEAPVPHASVVMMPDGEMFGRFLWCDDALTPIACISVVGPDLRFWYPSFDPGYSEEYLVSHSQAFGKGTTQRLKRLSIAVIGCSGTGSPLIEQLVRLGVGELVLVDDDVIEGRNINRILNSTVADAAQRRPKVEVLAEAIDRIGLGTRVRPFNRNLWDREVIEVVSECDVVFGCMDTVSGRYLLNTIATYYIIPYFDLGVRLEARPKNGGSIQVREICGTVHYLQPGRSSLMSRGLVSMDAVDAELLRKYDPAAYEQEVADGYIRGIQENRPAVISVNMFLASLAVNDFLARLHPYRDMPNAGVASIEMTLSSLELFFDPESERCRLLRDQVGLGDITPLLNFTAFADVLT